MGTLNMTKQIESSPFVMTGKDEMKSDVIHLANLRKKSKGYFRLKETEILVFVSISRKFFIFDQEKITYLKNIEHESVKKALAAKTVVLSDCENMIFNIPKKAMKSKLLDKVISNAGKELLAEEAMKLSQECTDLDQYASDIISAKKKKEAAEKIAESKK